MKPTITKVATAAVLLLSLAALHSAAQQPQVARIGGIADGSPAASAGSIDAFRQRLRELGYVEGRNLAMLLSEVEMLPDLALNRTGRHAASTWRTSARPADWPVT